MTGPTCRILVASLSVALLGSTAAAQQPKVVIDPKVAAILNAGKAPVGADRDYLSKYVKDKTQEMWSIDASKSVGLLEDLRKQIMPLAPDKSFAQLYCDAFAPFVDKKAGHPGAVLQIAHMVTPLTDGTTLTIVSPVLKKLASASDSAGGRYVALKALQTVRSNFAQFAPEKAFLIERCAKEDSAPVLAELFGVMDLSSSGAGADQSTTVALFVDGLKIRAKRCFDGDMGGIGGEVVAIRGIEGLTSAGVFKGQVKADAIESIFRLVYVSGVRYSQFDRKTVDALRMNQKPMRELRHGMAEVIIYGDRVLLSLLRDQKPGLPTGTTVEDAFGALVRSPLRVGNRDFYPDAIELLDLELAGMCELHKLARYGAFQAALNARREHINAVLKQSFEVKADNAEPAPWKLAE
jgi:hypothetical protein